MASPEPMGMSGPRLSLPPRAQLDVCPAGSIPRILHEAVESLGFVKFAGEKYPDEHLAAGSFSLRKTGRTGYVGPQGGGWG